MCETTGHPKGRLLVTTVISGYLRATQTVWNVSFRDQRSPREIVHSRKEKRAHPFSMRGQIGDN